MRPRRLSPAGLYEFRRELFLLQLRLRVIRRRGLRVLVELRRAALWLLRVNLPALFQFAGGCLLLAFPWLFLGQLADLADLYPDPDPEVCFYPVPEPDGRGLRVPLVFCSDRVLPRQAHELFLPVVLLPRLWLLGAR